MGTSIANPCMSIPVQIGHVIEELDRDGSNSFELMELLGMTEFESDVSHLPPFNSQTSAKKAPSRV